MEFSDYQKQASTTSQLDITTTNGRVELVLGLTAEVGAVSRLFKKLVRDDVPLEAQSEQLKDDLGDVLWYISMLATSMKMDLDKVAERNLRRTADRYKKSSSSPTDFKPGFEEGYPDKERFPRRMLFRLQHVDGDDGEPHVRFSIEAAEPNYFPEGNPNGRKGQGFTLGKAIGDVVNDNAAREDGYRYHDAVHIAFMTLLGWSPVMRGLLRLKRKSNRQVDKVEDGARARDLEEALSAVLKEMSFNRNNFATNGDIDGEVRDIIRRVISHLEVAEVPIWVWVDAIVQGYGAMTALQESKGGWITADLDTRTITAQAEKPEF